MRKAILKDIIQEAEDLGTTANEMLKYFNGLEDDGTPRFDIGKPIHGSYISFSDCISRILAVIEIIGKFDTSKNFLLVPENRFSSLSQGIKSTKSNLDQLGNQFRQAVTTGGGVATFNYENCNLKTKSGRDFDLRGYFSSFSSSTDGLLDAFYSVLIILQPTKAAYRFQAAADALSSIIAAHAEQLQQTQQENVALKRALTEAKQQVSTAEAHANKAKAAADEAIRSRDEGAKDRKTISEYLAEAIEKKTAIDSAHAQATSLEDIVDEYRDKFESFDRQLEARNKDFETGKNKQEMLFVDFAARQSVVDDVIKSSESMLKGATVAGLASSFSDAHRKLGWQLGWARLSFYVGIIFLFISAIPLMIFVFLPILAPLLQSYYPELADAAPSLDTQGEMSGWQYLGQVLARFIILLPAAWLVSFAAIRHSSLFRLREHYAYKYSMAVSVEGFQKKATGYESEIAALVLEQLAFNPADRLVHSKEIAEGRAPNPLLNLIIEKFRNGLRIKE